MDGLAKLGRDITARQAHMQEQRRQQWQRVQEEAPAHAELLSSITATFGKPKRVKITKDDGTVLLDSQR